MCVARSEKNKIACWKCILFYYTSLCRIRTADKMWFLNCLLFWTWSLRLLWSECSFICMNWFCWHNPGMWIHAQLLFCLLLSVGLELGLAHWGENIGFEDVEEWVFRCRFGRMGWEWECIVYGMEEMCLQGFDRQAWRKETIWKDGGWYLYCLKEVGWEAMDWIYTAQAREKWWAFLSMGNEHSGSTNAGIFWTSQGTIGFSRRTLLHTDSCVIP